MFVQNQAGVSLSTLSRAEEVVTHIFAASGIELRWSNVPVQGRYLRTAILDRGLHGLPEHALAFATLLPPGNASYAGVSLPSVATVAESEDIPLAIVLGASMAHEIGHVLLGSAAHAPSGIMSRRFARAQLQMAAAGRLLFTRRESRELRAAVTSSFQHKESLP